MVPRRVPTCASARPVLFPDPASKSGLRPAFFCSGRRSLFPRQPSACRGSLNAADAVPRPGRGDSAAGGGAPSDLDMMEIDPKTAAVWSRAEPSALELGLELVDIELRREGHGNVLRLLIDKAPGGVSLD